MSFPLISIKVLRKKIFFRRSFGPASEKKYMWGYEILGKGGKQVAPKTEQRDKLHRGIIKLQQITILN